MNSRVLRLVGGEGHYTTRAQDAEKLVIKLLEEKEKDFRWKKTAMLAIVFMTMMDDHGVFYGYAYRLGEEILNLQNNTEEILKFLVKYFPKTDISRQAESLLLSK